MSNTATRIPNLATVRKALAAAGRTPAEDTPKALKDAWLALQAEPTPAATPAPAEATPAKATPAPAAPKAKPAPANCGCGCGAPTVTERARFLSGHDARFAGQVGRGEVVPTDVQKALLAASPALQAKVDGIRATAKRNEAAKAARLAAKAAAKVAYDAAMAAI